eukprot:COSAG02_NODE_3314_length_6953_cov_4.605924_8_plen_98_part_00
MAAGSRAGAGCAHLYGASARSTYRTATACLLPSTTRRLTLQTTPGGLEWNMRRPNRTARFLQLFNDAEQQLDNSIDFDSLDSPGRIDWHLFRKYGLS